MNPILKRIQERRDGTPYTGDLIAFQEQEKPDPIPFLPVLSSSKHYKDCLVQMHQDARQGWHTAREQLKTRGGCFPPESVLNDALSGIYRRLLMFQESWQSKLTPRVLLLTAAGRLAAAASYAIDGVIAAFNEAMCGILDRALGRFVGQLTNFVGPTNCDEIVWEAILKDFSGEVENELQNGAAELEEGLGRIDEVLDRAVSESTLNAPNFTPDVVAPLILGAIMTTAIALGRALGTALGGMAGGPGGAVAAGLLIIIQQLLQGMNLEAFRGKTPEEMAKMLPNYDQLVQATQIALEKGTDVQTELANLGATA